jgi:hypothetical protein
MICCSEPGLTEVLYIHVKCKLHILTADLLLLTVTLANNRPVLTSERVPHINKPVTVIQ